MADLSLFRFSVPIDVRYADIDALQHVNNAKYFTYMETARVHYVREVAGWSGRWEGLGIIIARATCDYLLPIIWGDTLRMYMRTARMGTKSFDFEYVLMRENPGQPPAEAATGMTVQVAFDYERRESIRVPEDWRARITAYEPGLSK
jgi:acyl-CoA thioester hydrolase